jgi:hypothetical protein
MPIRYITVAAGLDYNETIVARDKHLVLFDTAANGTALKECLEGVVEFEEIEDCVAMPISDLLGITLHVSKIDGELDSRVFELTHARARTHARTKSTATSTICLLLCVLLGKKQVLEHAISLQASVGRGGAAIAKCAALQPQELPKGWSWDGEHKFFVVAPGLCWHSSPHAYPEPRVALHDQESWNDYLQSAASAGREQQPAGMRGNERLSLFL